MKRYIVFVLSLCMISFSFAQSKAEKKKIKETEITQAVVNRNYTFKAQTVNPSGDVRMIAGNLFPNAANLYQLSVGYDVRITKDSVIAYLPFFGRSYSAQSAFKNDEGGIKFTSTKFKYTQKIRKGGYVISIKPDDVTDINAMTLTVYPTGYSSLEVNSNSKSFISYSGIVVANK